MGTLSKAAGVIGILAVAYELGDIAAKKLVDSMVKSKEKANDLAQSLRDIASNEKLAKFFSDQAAALSKYADVSVATTDEINAMTMAQAQLYKEGAEGALALATQQEKAAASAIKAAQERMALLQAEGLGSAKSRAEMDELIKKVALLRDEQQQAAKAGQAFAVSLEQVALKVENLNAKSNAASTLIGGITIDAKEAAEALKAFSQTDLTGITKEIQAAVDAFIQARAKGQDFGKALEKAIPKDWLDTGIRGIMVVSTMMEKLIVEGLLPAKDAADKLEKELSGLDAEKLRNFGVEAQAAFEGAQISAQGLAVMMQGQLQAAMKKLGVDAETAGTNISKGFKQTAITFEVLASNINATGKQIKEGLDISIAAAKTAEEVKLLSDEIEQLGLRTGKFAGELADSFVKLEDKVRLTAGQLHDSLGDSFARLGVQTEKMFESLADQAEIDFERIKVSGQASAVALAEAFSKTRLGESFSRLGVQAQFVLDTLANRAVDDFNKIRDSGMASAQSVETAFRNMVAALTAASKDGIPPIELKVQYVDNKAFDLLVQSAETAADKVRTAIDNAISIADTTAKLKALEEGIVLAFERGKVSVEEFGRSMFLVGQNIRDSMAKPVGEVLAVVEKFGYQTKEMLQATSDNAKEAFDVMRYSGEFTTQELAKAAQAYMDAYRAANDGVVDSFDPVIQKAQEVIDKVGETTKKVDEMKKMSAPVETINLREQRPEQLQQQLDQITKAYRAIGVQNVQDLQIVKEIQAEMNRQGQLDAEKRRAQMDEAAKLLEGMGTQVQQANQAAGGGGSTGCGGQVAGKGGYLPQKGMMPAPITINLNGSSTITPDVVKREIAPVLRNATQRRI